MLHFSSPSEFLPRFSLALNWDLSKLQVSKWFNGIQFHLNQAIEHITHIRMPNFSKIDSKELESLKKDGGKNINTIRKRELHIGHFIGYLRAKGFDEKRL